MLACASMGAPAKGFWGSYQAWWAEGNRNKGMRVFALKKGQGVLPKEGFQGDTPWAQE